jgi:nucleoside-diphosphate-sugar epimerase
MSAFQRLVMKLPIWLFLLLGFWVDPDSATAAPSDSDVSWFALAIRHASERSGDVKQSLADIGKLRAAGFQPAGDFNSGLQTTIEFFKKPQP